MTTVGQDDMAEFMDSTEAAKLLGISARAFRNLRAQRPCPCYRFGDDEAHPRFRRDDLLAWAEQFRVEPMPARTQRQVRARRGSAKSWAEVVAGKTA